MKTETYTQDTPLVTAVITTHNRLELATKAIRSVQSQTYSNLELIVVDDASDREIKEVLSKLAKKENFQYIYIDKADSKGGNHARNIGIREGKGKYIAFLDDDDEWLAEKIQEQVSSLQEHPDCRVCYCGNIRDYNYGESQTQGETDALLDGDLSREILVKWQCLSSQMIVDRNLLFEVGLFDEELRFWQDYELCMRLFQKTEVCAVRENLVLYRIIKSDKQRLTNQVEGWEEAVSYIYSKHKDEEEKLSAKDKRRRNYFWYRDGVLRCEACGYKKREREYLWKIFYTTHNPKDFIKAILNTSSLRKLFRQT